MDIGRYLKEARKRAGLTQKELALQIGVATGTIQQYELDKRQPRLEQLCRIARVLNTTVSELVPPGYWGKVTPEEIDEAWGGGQARANAAMKQMTEEGRDKVADYAEDILPRYKKEAPKQGGE